VVGCQRLRELGPTRRDLLRAGPAAGVLAGFESLASPAQILERALATSPKRRRGCAPLSKNRARRYLHQRVPLVRRLLRHLRRRAGVRRSKRLAAARREWQIDLAQPFPGTAGEPQEGHLLPFHFDTTNGGECVNDISHEWKDLHECWNGDALDKLLRAHLKANPKDGHNTMGYFTRQDLPLFHALAENFTLCDRYFCSVLGPTDPNRLYSMSATIDLNARKGDR
jgi:phospholipase C